MILSFGTKKTDLDFSGGKKEFRFIPSKGNEIRTNYPIP